MRKLQFSAHKYMQYSSVGKKKIAYRFLMHSRKKFSLIKQCPIKISFQSIPFPKESKKQNLYYWN